MLEPTRTVDAFEVLHGDQIADPYRWLEAEDSAEVQAWAAGRDAHCRALLSTVPGRDALAARLTALARIGRVGGPVLRRGRLFFWQRTDDQDQPALLVRDARGAAPRVLIDPNTWAADGTTALDWWHPSDDGAWLAYGSSPGGTEISTLRVLRTDGGAVPAPAAAIAIERCRAADVAWLPDASGFYYTRYPRPGSVPPADEAYHRRVFFHALDAAPDGAEDALVFGEDLPKERWTACALTPDGRWLVFTVVEGWSRSEVYVLDRAAPGARPRPCVTGRDALFLPVPADDALYIVTNDHAPRSRVMRATWAALDRAHWREVIPEGAGTIEGCLVARDRLIVRELRNASHVLRVCGRDGAPQGEIPLPALGTVAGCDAEPDDTELVLDFQSFAIPPALYRVDLAGADLRPSLLHSVATEGGPRRSASRREDAGARAERAPSGGGERSGPPPAATDAPDATSVTVRQEWATSRDGTPIPLFVAARADAASAIDAPRRCLLYGYGGFNVSLTPTFSAGILSWIERGGVFAMANLRGGGEFGEDWHRAGMLARKQNTFDDFVAVADWLVSNGITTRDQLAIQGGSNGGLLVFAALTQRPDLCRAAIAQVPLADMLRYHRFQIARLWMPEYGDPDDAEHFPVLRAYSPYHRVTLGTRYPSVLVMTGESDTRVDPLHARKMTAALEAAQSDAARSILLRVERKAGHGQGMPLSKAIQGLVDAHCFLEWQLAGA